MQWVFLKLHILRVRKVKMAILNDMSSILKPGRATLVLGPPGAGKSTLLKAMAGKLNPNGLQVTPTPFDADALLLQTPAFPTIALLSREASWLCDWLLSALQTLSRVRSQALYAVASLLHLKTFAIARLQHDDTHVGTMARRSKGR